MIAAKAVAAGLFVGFVEFLAATDFNNTITTGAIVSTAVVIIVAGFFTWRAQMSSTWKDNYFAEKEKRENCEEEVQELRAQIIVEREEQQKLRHDLKNELAVALMKTDLTIHEAQESTRHDEMILVLQGLQESQKQIVGSLDQIATAIVKNGGTS